VARFRMDSDVESGVACLVATTRGYYLIMRLIIILIRRGRELDGADHVAWTSTA
jgi:hypothetical protein